MRFPRLRFSVRNLMVAVVVVALIVGSIQAIERVNLSRRYQQKARNHGSRARAFSTAFSEMKLNPEASREQRATFDELRRVIDHNVQLGKKYTHAATYPWLSLEPDPPEPPCYSVIVSSCPIDP
jgi:hypothetical protein